MPFGSPSKDTWASRSAGKPAQRSTSGCRRLISSTIAAARTPGAASSIGTVSLRRTLASGPGRGVDRGMAFAIATADQFRSDRQSRWRSPLSGGAGKGMGLTGPHIQPRLAVSARQALILLLVGKRMLRQAKPSLTTLGISPPVENARRPREEWPAYGWATPSLRHPIPPRCSTPMSSRLDCRCLLILIVAGSTQAWAAISWESFGCPLSVEPVLSIRVHAVDPQHDLASDGLAQGGRVCGPMMISTVLRATSADQNPARGIRGWGKGPARTNTKILSETPDGPDRYRGLSLADRSQIRCTGRHTARRGPAGEDCRPGDLARLTLASSQS
jgi:hypothetical protein